jgi:hypothetical protein
MRKSILIVKEVGCICGSDAFIFEASDEVFQGLSELGFAIFFAHLRIVFQQRFSNDLRHAVPGLVRQFSRKAVNLFVFDVHAHGRSVQQSFYHRKKSGT